jgi:hypothetical protein
MAKTTKRIGRPPTGMDPMVGVRMPPAKRKEIAKWAAAQPDRPSFSEAVRRLVDIGLNTEATAKPRRIAKRKDEP